jgi:hypothetical protein
MKQLALLLALTAACAPKDDETAPKPTPTPGQSGGEDGGAPPPSSGNPYKCAMYTKAVDVEEKIVLPRCGKDSNCHSGATWKPTIKTVGMIVGNLLDKAPSLYCSKDKYVNRADPAKSVMLVKMHAKDDKQKCPDGTSDLGLRMPPNMPPSYTEPPLSQAERDCISWWIYEIAK